MRESTARWRIQTIYELGGMQKDTVQTGPFGAQLHASDYVDTGVPLILIKNIKDSGLSEVGIPKVSEADATRLSKYRLQVGDIVFSRVGRVGSCFLVTPREQGWLISGQTLRIRHQNPAVCSKYLLYALRTEEIQNYITGASVGSTRTSINSSILESMEVKIPPLPEQKKIAAILTSIDEVIEKTEAQIAKLQDLKTAMMQELLTNGIGHTDFKDSPVGRIPASWEAKTVRGLLSSGALVAVQDGNHGSQYPRREEFSAEGLPYLSASHISLHNEIDFSRCPKLPVKRAEELRIPPAKGGDVILTHNATIGRTAIIPEEHSRVIASTSTTYYRVNSEVLSNAFLYYFFQSACFQGQLQKVMGQTTRNQVPITEQRKLIILLPTLEEQNSLAVSIGALSNRIGLTYQKLTNLRLQKKALMQDLLTGRVRVKV